MTYLIRVLNSDLKYYSTYYNTVIIDSKFIDPKQYTVIILHKIPVRMATAQFCVWQGLQFCRECKKYLFICRDDPFKKIMTETGFGLRFSCPADFLFLTLVQCNRKKWLRNVLPGTRRCLSKFFSSTNYTSPKTLRPISRME